MTSTLLAAATETAAFVLFYAAAAVLTIIDLRTLRLPDRILLPSMAGVVGLFLATTVTLGAHERLSNAVLLANLSVVIHLALHLANRAALGFGDVKLSALTGLVSAWLGVEVWLASLVTSFLAAGMGAGVLIATRRIRKTEPIAFGPWMLLATTGVVGSTFWGNLW